ncbi:MAG: hypothetical protein VXY23_15900 [Pseudomonadota bacterium]|jgi:hypothetical protein|nr:hypothetical protein [Pseudomonadota bacterium]
MTQTQKSPAPVAAGQQGFKSKNQQINYNTSNRKKAPPYASQIGDSHRLLIFFGGHDCWKLAKANNAIGRDAVALPVGESPESKNWICAEGRSVVCIELDDTGAANRLALARCLAAYFAYEVAVIPHDYKPENSVVWGCS